MNKQSNFTRVSIVLLVIVSVLSFVVSVGAQDQPARTYYESLNLSTPEDAAQTFADAFAREDFWTVFMVFSPEAQREWQAAMSNFNFKKVFPVEYEDQIIENIPRYVDMESFDISATFDLMMYKAAQDDALLIDLRGETTLGSSTETIVDDVPAVDVSATVDGIEGEVIFRMVQSPSQRWRVLQVIVEGGDQEMVPWSVPAATDEASEG